MPLGRVQVVERGLALGRAFADARAPIILTATDFAPGYADIARGAADAAWALPAEGLPVGFATLVPEIDALPASVRITKRQMNAFFGAELDLQLRRRGCTAVVIGGVATNFGVEATARAAFELDYDVIIAADACSSVAPGLHEFAVERILSRFARVRQTAEIVAALSK